MSKFILLAFLVLGLAFAQIGEQPVEGQDNREADFTRQQQQTSMKMTACLVLSRYHSNTQKQEIEGKVAQMQPEDQQKFINKMYVTAVEHCFPTITIDDAQKFFIADQNFDPSELFHVYENFDYLGAAKNLKLNKQQQSILKFIKNFDEENAVRREENEAKRNEEYPEQQSYSVKFFGFQTSDFPHGAKYVYLTIFAAVVGGSIYYLMSKLDGPKKQKKDKSSKKRQASPGKSPQSQSSSQPKASPTKPVKKQ